jgi:ribosomal protein S15P/S13E
VGIGTTTPQYRLAVNGTIGTKEVVVTNTGWADYVFRPGYRLRPLSEVDAYIQANHRLPDIPSEAEVRENGVSVGSTQAKLLAKIEELTLHVIQQEKDRHSLRERMAQEHRELCERMAQENRDLRERIAELEAHAGSRRKVQVR